MALVSAYILTNYIQNQVRLIIEVLHLNYDLLNNYNEKKIIKRGLKEFFFENVIALSKFNSN